MKLSTKTAVLKRVSLLFGGGQASGLGGQTPLAPALLAVLLYPAGSIDAVVRLGNTAVKKRLSGGEELAALCPI